jgi:FkbM family methyltransferase
MNGMVKIPFKYVVRNKIADILLSEKKKIKQARINGYDMLVPVDEGMGWKIYYLRNYEKEETNLIRRMAGEDWIFFDIGANMGYYTLLFSTLSKKGRVYSFEPIPLCYHLLIANILLNDVSNVEVNNFALNNYNGVAQFSISKKSETSSFIHTGRDPIEKIIQTEVRKLDDYIKENAIERIDFVKIDVEGSEKLVLEGALESLSKKELRPKVIMMELYDLNFVHYQTSVDEIVKFLDSYEYDAFIISKGSVIPFAEEHYNVFFNVFFVKKEIAGLEEVLARKSGQAQVRCYK